MVAAEGAVVGDEDAMRALLAGGADPNARAGGGRTALHNLALALDHALAQGIVGGFDDDDNEEGGGPDAPVLQIADARLIVILLLEAGADPAAVDDEGRDALAAAIADGNTAGAVALITEGNWQLPHGGAPAAEMLDVLLNNCAHLVVESQAAYYRLGHKLMAANKRVAAAEAAGAEARAEAESIGERLHGVAVDAAAELSRLAAERAALAREKEEIAAARAALAAEREELARARAA